MGQGGELSIDPVATGGRASIASFVSHPDRGAILAEVHARPFHAVAAPRRIIHFAFLTDDDAAEAAAIALEWFCRDRGLDPPLPGRRHVLVSLADRSLRWERHNEFITMTWLLPVPSPRAFDDEASSAAAIADLLPQPGPLLVAIDLQLAARGTQVEVEQGFDPNSLCAAAVEGGAAVVATDFAPRADGFVRIRVADRNLGEARGGAVTQRMLELETYRMLALLGLPEAQRLTPSVRRIEHDLAAVTRDMTHTEGLEDNRRLLDRLTGLAAELEAGAAASLFRFGASRAYYDIMNSRLAALRAAPVEGCETLEAFLNRRMAPAMRTCATVEQRQATLSQKLARAAQLLRTRVEIELEEQNRDLLLALSERSSAQLRLQQTVEGLSVAAVSYYVLSIVSYMLQGAAAVVEPHFEPKLAVALAAPFVLAVTAYVVLRLRRAHASPERGRLPGAR